LNLGWQLVDVFECGLLQNKMREYLATSLYGWLVMKYDRNVDEDDYSGSSNSEDALRELELRNYNCGLEI
jgi:hypothetical protein